MLALRTRAGFLADVVGLSERSQEFLFGVVLGFVAEAIELDQLEVLGEWELGSHPGRFAIPLAEGEYLTLSIEREGAEEVVYLERAGGSEVLAAPRRE
jgi:hypothetical protein